MNSFNPNYFIHAANVLLVVAYSVRDILWLRLFAGRSLADFHPIFRATADNAVGAAQLECRVCSDQFAAIMASLHRASSS